MCNSCLSSPVIRTANVLSQTSRGCFLSRAIPLPYPLTCVAASGPGAQGGSGGATGAGNALGEQSCCEEWVYLNYLDVTAIFEV